MELGEVQRGDDDRVIQALATVPEKSLRIIELTRELVGPDGQVDYNKASERAPEINLAVAEAEAYVRGTARAIKALQKIPARKVTA